MSVHSRIELEFGNVGFWWGEGKTGVPGKNLRSRVGNQQQTQPTRNSFHQEVGKHTRVFPYSYFVLYSFLRALHWQNRAQPRLLYLLHRISVNRLACTPMKSCPSVHTQLELYCVEVANETQVHPDQLEVDKDNLSETWPNFSCPPFSLVQMGDWVSHILFFFFSYCSGVESYILYDETRQRKIYA